MINDGLESCRACGSSVITRKHTGRLFNDLDVKYFECSECQFVQTEEPYWLERAYGSAINDSDTGIMTRNQTNAKVVLATLLSLKKLNSRVVDCAGGYGILVRLLRDYGIEALWSDRYCNNLLARGFEHTDESAGLVTAFEAFEHFVNPAEELDRMLLIAPNVLLSTELIPDPTPRQEDWWYYGPEHGQHIGFFRIKTLKKLAADRGNFFLSLGHSYHLISEKIISPVIWKALIRAKRVVPLFLRRKLVSKTWSDHLLNAEKKINVHRISSKDL